MFKEERLELLLAKSAEVNKTCVKRMLEKGMKRFNVEARNMVYTILRRNDCYSLPNTPTVKAEDAKATPVLWRE